MSRVLVIALLASACQCGPTETGTGAVVLAKTSFQIPGGGLGHVTQFQVDFRRSEDAGCEVSTSSECRFTRCPVPALPSTKLAVGTLTLDGTRIDGGVRVDVQPDGGDEANRRTWDESGFEPGDTLSLRASGAADVPAFSATLRAPAPVSAQLVDVDRSQPLVATWSGGSDEIVMALSRGQTSIVCYAPATLGSFTFPPELVSRLEPPSAVFQLQSVARTRVMAGSVSVSFAVTTAGVNGTVSVK